MKRFKNIFRRKEKQAPKPLAVEGAPPAPFTYEPDDAELAAQALLELMAATSRGQVRDMDKSNQVTCPPDSPDTPHDAMYYKKLAERIKTAQEAARLRTLRFLAFVEQELAKKELPLTGPGSLGLLEAELMKRLDVIERVGGELKTRWQHCVAQVMVRLMQATSNDNDNETTN